MNTFTVETDSWVARYLLKKYGNNICVVFYFNIESVYLYNILTTLLKTQMVKRKPHEELNFLQ